MSHHFLRLVYSEFCKESNAIVDFHGRDFEIGQASRVSRGGAEARAGAVTERSMGNAIGPARILPIGRLA